jgi:hypothetical protein
MYVGSSDCGCDVLERARLFAVVVWVVNVVMGCVFKLRLEVWDDISSSMAVFESRDIDSAYIESSYARSITDGGCNGETVGGVVVVAFCCGGRNVKSSIGVRPS